MQRFIAFLVALGAVIFLVILGGNPKHFLDLPSAVFLVMFIYSLTAISFGGKGIMVSIQAFCFLFRGEVKSSSTTQYIASILRKQIGFSYAGGVIGVLVGSISIHSNYSLIESDKVLHLAYAVNILIFLYATVLSEVLLRPLSIKLTANTGTV